MKSAQRAAAASEGDSAGEGPGMRLPRGVDSPADSPLARRSTSADVVQLGSSSTLVAAATAAGLVAASDAISAAKAAAL